MSKKKNFTKIERHLIKQCMIDADIMGLGKQETIEYVKSRLNLDFSEGSYKKYRSEILNNNDDDESNVSWISYYARQGFVEFYRKRIVEMEMIQKETLQQWNIETNKPDSQKDKNLIIKLVDELRSNNQHLTSLGMATPIIATIKNIIDGKDKLDNANQFIHSINYKIRREDTNTSGNEADDSGATTTEDSGPAEPTDNNFKF